MIYIRDEGETVRNGFNFYPLKSASSRGVVIRLGNHTLWLRYSKFTGKFICQKLNIT